MNHDAAAVNVLPEAAVVDVGLGTGHVVFAPDPDPERIGIIIKGPRG
jgi:hypothetical protein